MVRSEVLTDEKLDRELQRLEAEYGMSSSEFFERYQAGQMEHSNAILRWAWLYSIALRKRACSKVNT